MSKRGRKRPFDRGGKLVLCFRPMSLRFMRHPGGASEYLGPRKKKKKS